MPRIIEAFKQFLDGNGDPLVDGWIKFLVSGTNNTDKDTYADVSETVPNTNPLQLDAEGRCPSVFGTGSYRVISYTNDEVTPGPSVQLQVFDPVGGTGDGDTFAAWDYQSIYSQFDIVQGTDDLYYRSLESGNQGNAPAEDVDQWERVDLIFYYSASRTYSEGDVVRIPGGEEYTSIADGNLGNNPVSTSGYWSPVSYEYWETQDEAYTAVAGDFIALDSASAAFTVTLPASPVDMDKISFKDITNDISTNNVTIGRNGNSIMGLSEDMTVSVDSVTFSLTWFESQTTWRI